MAFADQELEAVRRRGFAVAYRMLGTVAEAEDVVQEALLRLAREERRIEEPAAWITTVVTRLSIDVLRLARVRRETYVGPWLPDPLVEDRSPGPGAQVELADSVSQAFLVVLEQLTPVERAAFLLREVFDYDYASVARIVDRSEPNCRQLVTRARRHLRSNRPRFDADPAARDRLLERFLAATEQGDLAALERMLAEDAVLYADGGGKATAARRPIPGGARIARVLSAIARKRRRRGPFGIELVAVNGQPGRILRAPDGSISDVLSIDVAGGRIRAVRIVRNPDKLAHLQARPAAQAGFTATSEMLSTSWMLHASSARSDTKR
jgi:RNA polymerase sigma-70 factor (ECF subfamily)